MLPLIEAIVVSQTVSNTETGSFSATVTLSGSDSYVYAAEAGTISTTISLSGTDGYAYAPETGTITVTIALSGADSYGATVLSTNTILQDRHHNVVQTG